jgi:hypothetical protein
MDIFDLEILRFWEALNKNKALCLMVGGLRLTYMVTNAPQRILISG